MMQDKALNFTYSQIGGLTSILPIAYGFSKFLSGVLGSRTSATKLLAGKAIAADRAEGPVTNSAAALCFNYIDSSNTRCLYDHAALVVSLLHDAQMTVQSWFTTWCCVSAQILHSVASAWQF